MSMNVRDQARRFITLVDELYNARTLLVVSAACPPDALFSAASGSEEPIIDLESLQFETAVEGGALACWPVCGCGGSGCWFVAGSLDIGWWVGPPFSAYLPACFVTWASCPALQLSAFNNMCCMQLWYALLCAY
jgi:hypothetical protein